jgi:hypothetical protein
MEVMKALQLHQLAAALQFAILGEDARVFDLGRVAHEFKTQTLSSEGFIKIVLNSDAGKSLYENKTTEEILTSVYKNIYGVLPEDESLEYYVNVKNNTGPVNAIEYKLHLLFDDLFNYKEFNSQQLDKQSEFIKLVDATYKTSEAVNFSLSNQELVATAYLAILGRGIDAQGFNAYISSLESGKHSIDYIVNDMIISKEAGDTVGNLYGNDFINYIFNRLIDRDATQKELTLLSMNGRTSTLIKTVDYMMTSNGITEGEKGLIIKSVGESLVFDKNVVAELLSDGTLLTSANTGKPHILSAVEITGLVNLTINSDYAMRVDLTQAGKLATVKIVGNQGLNLIFDPAISPLVIDSDDCFVGTNGNDIKVLTDVTEITQGRFYLNGGNDSLLWYGPVDNLHHPSSFIFADGGDGVDIVSANFFIKPPSSGNPTPKSPNFDNFKNFEKLDLGGYSGLFEFYWTSIDKGFSLSKKADNVIVDKINKETALNLEILHDATSQSKIEFIIDGVAKDDNGRKANFDIIFNSKDHNNIDGGTIKISTTPNPIEYKLLSSVTIKSYGEVGFTNILKIEGSGISVGNACMDAEIVITGSNRLDLIISNLTLASNGFAKTIDASGNSGGLSLTSDYQVPLYEALQLRWLADNIKDANGRSVNDYIIDGHYTPQPLMVIGTNNDDIFDVASGSMITSGGGSDLIKINAASHGYIRISDFNLNKDAVQFGDDFKLSINGGLSISDYGVHTFDEIGSSWIEVFMNNNFSNDSIVSNILSLAGPLAEIGVLSLMDQDGVIKSFVINDKNNDHKFDANDSYIMLDNQSHQELVDGLKYSPVVELNGVNAEYA